MAVKRYNGTVWITEAGGSASTIPSGTINPYAGISTPSGWLLCDGSAVSRTTYSTLYSSLTLSKGTFTVTIATPAVVTITAHGLATGSGVFLTTSGALPTGLTANTLYYVISTGANTFNLATTLANAIAGTAIATSGTQSGTHTATFCPYGVGDGSTTFNVPDMRGRTVAGKDDMGGTPSNRITTAAGGITATALGSAGGDARLQAHTHTYSAPALSAPSYFTAGGALNIWAGTPQSTASGTGGTGSSENIQPTIILNYIIKV